MDEADIRTELLVLIEQSIPAQRLIVTWPKAYLEFGESLDVDPADLTSDHAFSERWGRISDVDIDDVARLAPMLFENGLLWRTGETSPTAHAFVLARGAGMVRAKK